MLEKKATNYDLSTIEKVKAKRFNIDLYSVPNYQWKYTEIVFEEMSALLTRQLAKGIGTFIDIGAHYGFYSTLVGTVNSNVKIFSFEPIPENFNILKKNVLLNNIGNIILKNEAVSASTGVNTFQVSEQSSQSGFIANPDEPVIYSIDVNTIKLDDYFDQIVEGPVLVKIDTEGNELNVLKGMDKIIENHDDIRLLIEFNPSCLQANSVDPQFFLEYIIEKGFDIIAVFDIEKEYRKINTSHNWQNFMGERTYRNLYCVKKEQSMNLCFFSHSAGLAGAEKSLIELVSTLISKQGAICTVILPSDGPGLKMIEDLGASVIICPYNHWSDNIELSQAEIDTRLHYSLDQISSLLPKIEKICPDVIITNTIVIPWGAYIASILNLTHIWWVKEYGVLDHQLHFFYIFEEILETIQNSSNFVIVNSNAVYEQYYSKIPVDRCEVAYNIIDLPKNHSTDEQFYYDQDALKLLISGTIIPTKGQDDAISAVSRLLEEGYNIELRILGSTNTPFSEKLIKMVEANKLGKKIHFLGFTNNFVDIVNQSDIVLICSNNEAFGRVTAEAMLMGKTVIGTNSGGTKELIEDGKTGLLYEPGNIQDLINKIKYIISNRDKLKEFGLNAKSSIEQKLAERPVDLLFLKVFKRIKDEKNISPLSNYIFNQFSKYYINSINNNKKIINEKEQTIESLNLELSNQINEKDQIIESLNLELSNQINEKDQIIESLNLKLSNQINEKDQIIESLNLKLSNQNFELVNYATSTSWIITRPFRKISERLKRKSL